MLRVSIIRNGYLRPEDYGVMLDTTLAQVKAKSEMKEFEDYVKQPPVLPAE